MVEGSSRSFVLSSSDSLKGLLLDTIARDKQCLVFVNSKRSAEKEAEDASRFLKHLASEKREVLSKELLDVLGSPTRQCKRLAVCARSGIAFHHAGLHHKQRELIEDGFRDGTIQVIACTPTLAAGLDLPAFRAIIRDMKRYTGRGMEFIPVLEYLQMAGRAGRPRFDDFGEAIIVCSSDVERDSIVEDFIRGTPESVTSKLAVEPVLRTYVLSLIASRVARSFQELEAFFSGSLWAFQFRDMRELKKILERVSAELVSESFLVECGGVLEASRLGVRVSELYVDPLTAAHFLRCIRRASGKPSTMALLHAANTALEARPLLKVSMREFEELSGLSERAREELLVPAPSEFEYDFESHLEALKSSLFFEEWINEISEENLLEKYNCRPGETRAKLSVLDWLLYSFGELARLEGKHFFISEVEKLRIRLEYGAREELLALLRLRGIGRVRARVLFRNGIKDFGALKNSSLETLSKLLGPLIAKKVKEQVESGVESVPLGRRVGQVGLGRFSDE